ncbi:phage tail tape measure protein [Clostridium paraputrificum]|uniref:phage tail tape measure protein n=1 Tax=Clostridium paraputrificum TaxID=29363 RepID=UPI00041431BD|nr:phage tail tape measure protein [Clostridium paraputrificum]
MALDLSAIRINVQADTKEAEKGLKSLKQKGESLASIGKSLTLGVTTPIVGIGTASLKAAADAAEMESKFDTVFKNISKEADEWATTYANAIGRSKYEIKEAISNQADLYYGMGFTADEAYELSKQVTTLGYDLASFNNVNDAQAVDAMTKALMGETESAKMLGVNLTDTIMETSEFTKATGKSWKELSMAEKAQVRYKEAVKQSSNAIGDAEKTSDSFTNMVKRLKGQLSEIGVEIGKVILPAADKIVKVLSGVLDKVLTFTKENPKLAATIVAIAGAIAAIGPTLWIVGKLTVLFASFPISAGLLAGGLGVAALAFVGLNENAQQVLNELPTKLSLAINYMLQKIVEFLPQFLAKGTEMLFNLIQGIVTAIPMVLETLVNLCFAMLGILITFFPQFMQIGYNFIKNLLDGAIAKFPEFIGNIIDGITTIINNITARMPEFISKGIEFVSSMAKGFKDNFPAILSKVGQLLKDIIAKIIEKLPDFIKAGWDLLKSIIKGLWDNRKELIEAGGDLLDGLWEGFKDLMGSFWDIGEMIVESIWDGVKSMWGSFTGWISSKMENIPIIGGFFRMTPEIDTDGLQAPDAAMFSANPLSRSRGRSPLAALDTPEFFGATRKSFNFNIPRQNNGLDSLKDLLQGIKDVSSATGSVIENVINIDGREFARVTTPYISKELAWNTR